MKTSKFLTLLILFVLSTIPLFSQTLRELEERKERTQRELTESTQLLQRTEKEREQSLSNLNILKRQLTLRTNLISDIEKQIELLERDIEEKTLLIQSYQNDLKNLKNEYAKMIRFAQRNRTDMQIMVFIFASSDFNQAYRRMRFYQQFLQFREKQAKEIIETQKAIESELAKVSTNRNRLAQSREEKTIEVNNLSKQQQQYSSSVRNLQQREAQLRKEVEERKKAMEALDKAIADLIAEETRSAKTQIRDARYLRISDGFAGNKGKLPWPTTTGVIVNEFGEHSHPVLKGIKIKNNGIDISTKLNEKVKTIFEGEVRKIVSIPGQNIAVLIRHGDFVTVYSNLIKVQVKVGDRVQAQQVIGEVYNDEKTQSGIYKLQIWQENTLLNPTEWILP
ncbi:MAG: peptidoglycan DD-metalloendopeptidase family protein [Bacteroidales bacterium]|nr:peptidoglycan DD-metalloendopeptidase family protein [Bacteroidales bacterium]